MKDLSCELDLPGPLTPIIGNFLNKLSNFYKTAS